MKLNLKLSHYLAVALPAAFLLLGGLSCGTDNPPPQPAITPPVPGYPDSLAGTMQVTVSHHVDNQPLAFANQNYVNAAGDTFRITKLKYFISNVKLTNTATGKTYLEKNSYHLLAPQENKNGFKLNGIPVKEFDQIEFSIGVDADANSRTDQTGDLDANTDMGWDWKTGYKFLNFGGSKVSRIAARNHALTFHIGGNQNYKTYTLHLGQSLTFQKDKPHTLQLEANLNELFRNPNIIDFEVINNVESGTNMSKLAENYGTGMFRIKSVGQ